MHDIGIDDAILPCNMQSILVINSIEIVLGLFVILGITIAEMKAVVNSEADFQLEFK